MDPILHSAVKVIKLFYDEFLEVVDIDGVGQPALNNLFNNTFH